MLAIGGVIKYELRAGARVSDTFVLQHVCPHSTRLLHEKVCLVLVKALLWAIFGEFSANLDSSYVANVKRAFLVLNPNWADGTNPVKKVHLQVAGHGGTLYITELLTDEEEGEASDEIPARVIRNTRDVEVRSFISQLCHVQRQTTGVSNELCDFKNFTNDLLRKMNLTMQRLSQAPIMSPRVRHTRGTSEETSEITVQATQQTSVARATLSKCPRTLYVLWQEYEFGLAG